MTTRILVAGWFSFETGHATAGDLLARDLVCDWLRAAGHTFDVAVGPPFSDGVDWCTAEPAAYTHAVFVCGPFEYRENERAFLERFAATRLVGVDLTMLVPTDVWQPFDALLERDSSATTRPDVVFASAEPLVPVVGVCLVEDYPAGDTATVNAAVARLVASRSLAVVPIDTRLDHNETGLRTQAEIESLLARMDVVITSRLHGMVLALKHGVPALVIDPEPGGAKIVRQTRAIGWPVVFTADALDDAELQNTLAYCLTDEARATARRVAAATLPAIAEVRAAFEAALDLQRPPPSPRLITPDVERWRPPDEEPKAATESRRPWDLRELVARVRRGGA